MAWPMFSWVKCCFLGFFWRCCISWRDLSGRLVFCRWDAVLSASHPHSWHFINCCVLFLDCIRRTSGRKISQAVRSQPVGVSRYVCDQGWPCPRAFIEVLICLCGCFNVFRDWAARVLRNTALFKCALLRWNCWGPALPAQMMRSGPAFSNMHGCPAGTAVLKMSCKTPSGVKWFLLDAFRGS